MTYPFLGMVGMTNKAWHHQKYPVDPVVSSGASPIALAFLEYTTANVSSFEVKTHESTPVNYDVDWGDGSTETNITTTLKSHTYSTAGVYVIKITPAEGSIFRPKQFGAVDYQTNLTKVDGVGGSQFGSNFLSAFRDIDSLTSVGNIDTSGVTNFSSTWRDCTGLTSFPLIDTSSGTGFGFAWAGCSGLTGKFPALNFSNATNVGQAWNGCSDLVEFPSVDFSSVTSSFRRTWYFCRSLTTFPANMFDNIGVTSSTGFQDAFRSCALTAQSIENILVSLDTWGASNIELGIHSGNNASKSSWSTAANTAYTNLINKGWTISYNA